MNEVNVGAITCLIVLFSIALVVFIFKVKPKDKIVTACVGAFVCFIIMIAYQPSYKTVFCVDTNAKQAYSVYEHEGKLYSNPKGADNKPDYAGCSLQNDVSNFWERL